MNNGKFQESDIPIKKENNIKYITYEPTPKIIYSQINRPYPTKQIIQQEIPFASKSYIQPAEGYKIINLPTKIIEGPQIEPIQQQYEEIEQPIITKKKVIEMMPVEVEIEEHNYPKKKDFKKFHAHKDIIDYERQAKMKRKPKMIEEEEEDEVEVYYQPMYRKVKKSSVNYEDQIQEPKNYKYQDEFYYQ